MNEASVGSISAIETVDGSAAYGSYMGGTMIRISGSGFAGSEARVTVFVGNNICKTIPYKSTDKQIICEVPPLGHYTSNEWVDIDVNLIAIDRAGLAACRTSNGRCQFRYRSDRTPKVDSYTHGVGAGESLTIDGSELGDRSNRNYLDLFEVHVGGAQCVVDTDSNPTATAEGERERLPNYNQVRCRTPAIPAGRYNVSLRVAEESGFPDVRAGAKAVDPLTDKVFHTTVYPTVEAVSFTDGGLGGGSEIVIKGSGFGSDVASSSIKVAGVDCHVTAASLEELRCITGAFDKDAAAQDHLPSITHGLPDPTTNSTAGFDSGEAVVLLPGGRGLTTLVYGDCYSEALGRRGPCTPEGEFDESAPLCGTCCTYDLERRLAASTNPNYPFYPTKAFTQGKGFVSDPESSWRECYSTDMHGFFVPPATANYTFWVMADDYLKLYLSEDEDPSKARMIINHNQYSSNYWSRAASKQRSETVELQAGKRYYMRGTHLEGTGGDYIRVGLRIHEGPETSFGPNAAAFSSVEERQNIRLHSHIQRDKQRVCIYNFEDDAEFRVRPVGSIGTEEASTKMPVNVAGETFADRAGSVVGGAAWLMYAEPRNSPAEVVVDDRYGVNVTGHCWTFSFNYPTDRTGGWPEVEAYTGDLRPADSRVPVYATAEKLQQANPAIDGTFRLRVGNNETAFTTPWSAPISARASSSAVRDALRALPGLHGVTVSRGGWVLDGLTWYITFYTPEGDVPDLEVDESMLTGSQPYSSLSIVEHGSTDAFLDPMPMDFFESAVVVPADRSFNRPAPGANSTAPRGSKFSGPVQVVSNGLLAKCASHTQWMAPDAASPCVFTYDEAITPQVVFVSAAEVSQGDTLHISGLNFLAYDPASPPLVTPEGETAPQIDEDVFVRVTIGGEPCALAGASSESELTCTVPHLSAGNHTLRVVVGKGRGQALFAASASNTLTYTGRVDSTAPEAGSLFGGTLLMVAGTGFQTTPSGNTVLVGGRACEVQSAAADRMTCLTPAAANTSQPATVSVFVNGVEAGTFAYAEANSPAITAIPERSFSAAVTSTVTLHTSGVPAGSDANLTVTIGGRACANPRATGSAVTCQLTRGAPQEMPQAAAAPLLRLSNRGHAGVPAGAPGLIDSGYRVASVSPEAGSFVGGTELTLSGAGFKAGLTASEEGVDEVVLRATLQSNRTSTAEDPTINSHSNYYSAGNGGKPGAAGGDDESTVAVDVPCAIKSTTATSITCVTGAPALPTGVAPEDLPASALVSKVSVKFNGIEAVHGCTGGEGFECTFAFAESATPTVTSAVTSEDRSELTVYGTRLSASTEVMVGSKACPLSSSAGAPESVTCTIAPDTAGLVYVSANVPGMGDARGRGNHTHELVVSGIDMANGSYMGGLEVQLTGFGFNGDKPVENVVYFDIPLPSGSVTTREAEVVGATYTTLTLRTPAVASSLSSLPSAAPGAANISVTVVRSSAAAQSSGSRRLTASLEHRRALMADEHFAPVRHAHTAAGHASLRAEQESGAAGERPWWLQEALFGQRLARAHVQTQEARAVLAPLRRLRRQRRLAALGEEAVLEAEVAAAASEEAAAVPTQYDPMNNALELPLPAGSLSDPQLMEAEAYLEDIQWLVGHLAAAESELAFAQGQVDRPRLQYDGSVGGDEEPEVLEQRLAEAEAAVAAAKEALDEALSARARMSPSDFDEYVKEELASRVFGGEEDSRRLAAAEAVAGHDALSVPLSELSLPAARQLQAGGVGAGTQSAQASLDLAFTFDPAASSTPRVSSVNPNLLTGLWAGDNITISGTGFGAAQGSSVVRVGEADCEPSAWADDRLTCALGQTRGGLHVVQLNVENKGWTFATNALLSKLQSLSEVTGVHHANTSSEGGREVVFTGRGFPTVADPTSADALLPTIGLCNSECKVTSSSYEELRCRPEPLVTRSSLTHLNNQEPEVLTGTPFADRSMRYSADLAFDGRTDTPDYPSDSYHYGWSSVPRDCGLGIDLGESTRGVVTRVRVYSRTRATDRLRYGYFEGSTDNTNWDRLATLGDRILEGWNYIDVVGGPGEPVGASNQAVAPDAPFVDLGAQPAYRYLRFRSASWFDNWCDLHELEFIGIPVSASEDGECPITLRLPKGAGDTQEPAPAVHSGVDMTVRYKPSMTPIVSAIEPTWGSALGGTNVTLRLGGPAALAGTEQPSDILVKLNGVPCQVHTVAADHVVCTSGARDEVRAPSVDLVVGALGRAAVNTTLTSFRYLDRWSAVTTWKGGEPPIDGDTVYIPFGQTVLLDQPTPKLFLLLIEGELVFERRPGLSLDATYTLVHGGKLEVGTEKDPFLDDVTLTMHGDRWETIELPNVGAKMIAVMNRNSGPQSTSGDQVPYGQWGILDIHGRPRKRTWTRLAAGKDATAGSSDLFLTEDVDFEAGDKIFITSSTSNTYESEVLTVKELRNDGNGKPRHVVVEEKLRFRHRAAIFQGGAYGHRDADMRAAVGILSRNILIQGGPKSVDQAYGVHTGSFNGGVYRITNVEITKAGQRGVLGRYPTHTHMLFDGAQGSFVKGNSIHHTFQRACTVHGAKHYEVKHNVAYEATGHTIFVEDGAEQWNVIEENLVANTFRNFIMLKGDTKPASFWTSSPQQLWRHNYAAGCTNDGYWFELPGRPHGPSKNMPFCPQRGHMGEFFNNTASGNGVHGLRIYPHYSPTLSCSNNTPFPQYYHNFTSFWNGANCIFGKINGDLHHVNPLLVECGAEEHRWLKFPDQHYRPGEEATPNVENGLYVGRFDGPLSRASSPGLLMPQHEYFHVRGLTLVNYGATGAIAGCADCESHTHMRQGGFTFRLEGLKFHEAPRRVLWTAPYKQMFWDLDGSLTGHAKGWATPYKQFLETSDCTKGGSAYDEGLVCTGDVILRRLQLDNVNPRELDFVNLAVHNPETGGTDDVLFRPKEIYGWVTPLIANKRFDLFFRSLVDYRTMRLRYSEPGYVDEFPDDNENLYLTFNYTDYRWEDRVVHGWPNAPEPEERVVPPTWHDHNGGAKRAPNADEDQFGTSWTDHANDTWHVVINTINATSASGWWKYVAVAEEIQCPPVDEVANARKYGALLPPNSLGCYIPKPVGPKVAGAWSDASTWPSGRVPQAGEHVTIHANMSVTMDTTPPKLASLWVYGDLVFDDSADRKLELDSLVVYGYMRVGNASEPFTHEAEIVLHGTRGSDAVILDNTQHLGNKVIAVYGRLEMQGLQRDMAWTRLATTASAGSKQLRLVDSVLGQWRAGDRLTLTPTEYVTPAAGASRTEMELEDVVIDSVSSDGRTVTLTEPLAFSHFAGLVDVGDGQQVPLRAAVGLLNRNVRVSSAFSNNGTIPNKWWDHYGGHIVVSEVGVRDSLDVIREAYQGSVELRHMELRGLGQMGLEHASVLFHYGLLERSSPEVTVPTNVIDGVSFSFSNNYGIVTQNAWNLEVKNSVFHRTYRTAIDVDSRSMGARIDGNLIAGVFRSPDETLRWVRPNAGIFLDTRPASLRGNVVGGSYDAGFTLRATVCPSGRRAAVGAAADPVADNEAHSALIGAFMLGDKGVRWDSCRQLSRFRAWKIAHVGVLTVDQRSDVRLQNVTVADSHIGVSLNFFRVGRSNVLSFVHVADSTISGSTGASGTCDKSKVCRAMGVNDVVGAKCNSVLGSGFRRAGFMTAQYTNRGKTCEHDFLPRCRPKNTPERLCSMPWEKRYGLPGVRHAHTTLQNVRFTHFTGPGSDCGADSSAVVHNPTQVDMAPTMTFTGIKWHNVTEEGRFWFRPTSRSMSCANGDCDGHSYVMIEDDDGSTTGLAGGMVLSHNPQLAAPSPFCSSRSAWGGFQCSSRGPNNAGRHLVRRMVWDNVDSDRGFRRLGEPVNSRAIVGGQIRNITSNGPIDDGCAKRFFFGQYPSAATPAWDATDTDYENFIRFSATLPDTIRMHFHSDDPNERFVVRLFVQSPNSREVFYNGNKVANPEARYPTINDPAGFSLFDPRARMLYFTVRGGNPGAFYEIRKLPAVQLSLTLSTTVEEFYGGGDGERTIVDNMALLLGIPPERIKVVDVQPGSVVVQTEILPANETSSDLDSTAEQANEMLDMASTVKEKLVSGELSDSLPFEVEGAGVDVQTPALQDVVEMEVAAVEQLEQQAIEEEVQLAASGETFAVDDSFFEEMANSSEARDSAVAEAIEEVAQNSTSEALSNFLDSQQSLGGNGSSGSGGFVYDPNDYTTDSGDTEGMSPLVKGLLVGAAVCVLVVALGTTVVCVRKSGTGGKPKPVSQRPPSMRRVDVRSSNELGGTNPHFQHDIPQTAVAGHLPPLKVRPHMRPVSGIEGRTAPQPERLQRNQRGSGR